MDKSTDDSLEMVLSGQCIHGQQDNCLTCSLIRSLSFSLRRMLEAMFPIDKND